MEKKPFSPDSPEKTEYQAKIFANRLSKQYKQLRKWARKKKIHQRFQMWSPRWSLRLSKGRFNCKQLFCSNLSHFLPKILMIWTKTWENI